MTDANERGSRGVKDYEGQAEQDDYSESDDDDDDQSTDTDSESPRPNSKRKRPHSAMSVSADAPQPGEPIKSGLPQRSELRPAVAICLSCIF